MYKNFDIHVSHFHLPKSNHLLHRFSCPYYLYPLAARVPFAKKYSSFSQSLLKSKTPFTFYTASLFSFPFSLIAKIKSLISFLLLPQTSTILSLRFLTHTHTLQCVQVITLSRYVLTHLLTHPLILFAKLRVFSDFVKLFNFLLLITRWCLYIVCNSKQKSGRSLFVYRHFFYSLSLCTYVRVSVT